jgi:hypothetical protein
MMNFTADKHIYTSGEIHTGRNNACQPEDLGLGSNEATSHNVRTGSVCGGFEDISLNNARSGSSTELAQGKRTSQAMERRLQFADAG